MLPVPEGALAARQTTNPVESPFAAAGLRTDAATCFREVANTTAVICEILLVGELAFRKVKHPELMQGVFDGVSYVDEVEVKTKAAA